MASMFQNGISRNARCAEGTVFAEKVKYNFDVSCKKYIDARIEQNQTTNTHLFGDFFHLTYLYSLKAQCNRRKPFNAYKHCVYVIVFVICHNWHVIVTNG